jgi:hypothetical protein
MSFCNQQTATGRSIQSMHQFEPVPFIALRARAPEQLNDTKTDPAPTMDGKTRRLIQYEKVTVFIQHSLFDPLGPGPVRHRVGTLRCALKRGDTNLVPSRQTPAGPCAPLVDPDLSTSDYPVNKRPGQPLQAGQQVVVEAPIGIIGFDGQRL